MLAENRRIWILGGVVIAIVVIVLGGYLSLRGRPESKLTVVSIPNDLTLTLDGQPVAANGEIKVKEGQHTLSAQRQGFQSYTQAIKAVGGNPLSVKMYLYSNSAAGRNWEKDHPDQTLAAEAEAGRRFDEINQRLNQKYPILRELPYIGPGFKAESGASKIAPNNPEQIAVYITLFDPTGKAKALEWLNGHGYNPAELELIFTTK